MITQVDDDGSGNIGSFSSFVGVSMVTLAFQPAEFSEFLKVFENHKTLQDEKDDETDLSTSSRLFFLLATCAQTPFETVDAFVAMGGKADKTGQIEAEKLRKTIKAFELTIDIEVGTETEQR